MSAKIFELCKALIDLGLERFREGDAEGFKEYAGYGQKIADGQRLQPADKRRLVQPLKDALWGVADRLWYEDGKQAEAKDCLSAIAGLDRWASTTSE